MKEPDRLPINMADNGLKLELFDGSFPGEKVMVLEGCLTAETAFAFRDAVRERDIMTLVIDMNGVRYVDSSGLGVLIGTYASLERNCKRLLLAGVTDRVWELFRMCKIEDVFTRYPNVAAAEQTIADGAQVS